MDGNKIKVLLVETAKEPRITYIEDSLEALQKAVGGYIEEYMPFVDEVAIVCNEEGKIRGLPPNRAVRSENGEILDIIAGDFLVVNAPMESERYLDLTDSMVEKYGKMFKEPLQLRRNMDDIER